MIRLDFNLVLDLCSLLITMDFTETHSDLTTGTTHGILLGTTTFMLGTTHMDSKMVSVLAMAMAIRLISLTTPLLTIQIHPTDTERA